jgi:hypothetical protein
MIKNIFVAKMMKYVAFHVMAELVTVVEVLLKNNYYRFDVKNVFVFQSLNLIYFTISIANHIIVMCISIQITYANYANQQKITLKCGDIYSQDTFNKLL